MKKAKWKQDLLGALKSNLDILVNEPNLADLYPVSERWINGSPVATKWIMPHQQILHDKMWNGKKVDYLAISGGVGSGKTVASIVDIVAYALKYPGSRQMVIMSHDWQFDEIFLTSWQSVFGDFTEASFIRKYNMKMRRFYFTNKSTITLKSFESALSIRGFEVHRFHVEEWGLMCDGNNQKQITVFAALKDRLRAKPVYPYYITANQNPDAGYNGLWKIFVEQAPEWKDRDANDKGELHTIAGCQYLKETRGKQTQESKDKCKSCAETCTKLCSRYPRGGHYWTYFYEHPETGETYLTLEVPTAINTELREGYIENATAGRSEADRRTMIEGRFGTSQELAFPPSIYSPQYNVVPLKNILDFHQLTDTDEKWIESWRPVRIGIDPGGASSPTGCNVCVYMEETDTWIVIDEARIPKSTVWDELIDIVMMVSNRWETKTFYYDPGSGTRREGPNLISVKDQFRMRGITINHPHPSGHGYSKESGLDVMRNLFKADHTTPAVYWPDEQDDDGMWKIGKSKLIIAEGMAPWLCKELAIFRKQKDAQRIAAFEDADIDKTSVSHGRYIKDNDHEIDATAVAIFGTQSITSKFKRAKKSEWMPPPPNIKYGGKQH